MLACKTIVGLEGCPLLAPCAWQPTPLSQQSALSWPVDMVEHTPAKHAIGEPGVSRLQQKYEYLKQYIVYMCATATTIS
jgi:hypothetical protein